VHRGGQRAAARIAAPQRLRAELLADGGVIVVHVQVRPARQPGDPVMRTVSSLLQAPVRTPADRLRASAPAAAAPR